MDLRIEIEGMSLILNAVGGMIWEDVRKNVAAGGHFEFWSSLLSYREDKD